MGNVVTTSSYALFIFTGGLFGSLLVFLLGLVTRLITRLSNPSGKCFATRAYWILAGLVFAATYVFLIRDCRAGQHLNAVAVLYLGAALPVAYKAGLFARLTRYLPQAVATDDPSAFRTVSRLERIALTTKPLAYAAMLCWGISLCLPVFVHNSKVEYQLGWDILITGWLGAVTLQFAWYANVLLLIAFVHLIKGRCALGYMAAAVLLSLETFVKPPFTDAYGFGWGMIVWFIAVALMVAAAGAHQIRGGRRTTLLNGGWLRLAGIGMCVVIAAIAMVLSVRDFKGANAAETRRMEHAAFKHGAVCRAEPAQVVPALAPLSGPLEVKQLNLRPGVSRTDADILYSLTDWRMPVLRNEGRDYFYIRRGKETLFSSTPARGPAAATLEIDGDRETPHLRLLDGNGRQLFDQTWVKPPGATDHCPDYSMYPSANQQPRLMISQALGLDAPPVEKHRAARASHPRMAGKVISRTLGAKAADEPLRNANCAADVGWRKPGPVSAVVASGLSGSFWIGQQAYYLSGAYEGKALCQGEYVYLYNSTPAGVGRDVLMIQKRRLSDFGLIKTTALNVKDPGLDNLGLQLNHVDDAGSRVIVDVSRPALGLSLRVKAKVGL